MTANELNKAIGNLWKKLSAGEKAGYEMSGRKDKERYFRELTEYNAISEEKIAPRCACIKFIKLQILVYNSLFLLIELMLHRDFNFLWKVLRPDN